MFEKLYRAYRILRTEGGTRLADAVRTSLQWQVKMRRRRVKQWPQYWYQVRHHGAVADPYALIDISPADVDYLVSPHFQDDLPPDGTYIVGGDWDRTVAGSELYFFNGMESVFRERKLVPLDQYVFYRAVENHIRRDTQWSETEFYRWATTLEDTPEHILYGNSETCNWRFEQLDRLAQSMREEGYKSQRECGDETAIVSGEERAGTTVSRWADSSDVPPEFHEVMVNIGRDGELFFEEGRHRFAVARALGIDSIPVRVFVRHVEWQKKRTEVAQATTPAGLSPETKECLSHPDMADVRTF